MPQWHTIHITNTATGTQHVISTDYVPEPLDDIGMTEGQTCKITMHLADDIDPSAEQVLTSTLAGRWKTERSLFYLAGALALAFVGLVWLLPQDEPVKTVDAKICLESQAETVDFDEFMRCMDVGRL